MSWKLNRIKSSLGEMPGTLAKFQENIHFEGSKYTIEKNDVCIVDFHQSTISSKNKGMSQFVTDARKILGPNWKYKSIKIRANGDCYAYSSGDKKIYLGNVSLSEEEPFSGYLLTKKHYPKSDGFPKIYLGPQTRQQIGEKWTIAPESYSTKQGKKGKLRRGRQA